MFFQLYLINAFILSVLLFYSCYIHFFFFELNPSIDSESLKIINRKRYRTAYVNEVPKPPTLERGNVLILIFVNNLVKQEHAFDTVSKIEPNLPCNQTAKRTDRFKGLIE